MSWVRPCQFQAIVNQTKTPAPLQKAALGETLERQSWAGSEPSCLVQISPWTEQSSATLGLRPFLTGQTFVREHSWEYSANIVGSSPNVCFVNIAGGLHRTVTKIYSGSKKICSTCSEYLPYLMNLASDWLRAESSPVDEKEKKKMDDGITRYFTHFRGNLFIWWLVGGTALSLGPRMI